MTKTITMKKKCYYALLMFFLFPNLLLGNEFTVEVDQTDNYANFIKPLKPGASYELKVDIINNWGKDCRVLLDTSLLYEVRTWIGNRTDTISIDSAGTGNFYFNIQVPQSAEDRNYYFPLYFKAFEQGNASNSTEFHHYEQTIIVDKSDPYPPNFIVKPRSTSIKVSDWTSYDVRSNIYNSYNQGSGVLGIYEYKISHKTSTGQLLSSKTYKATGDDNHTFSSNIAPNSYYKVGVTAVDIAGNTEEKDSMIKTAPPPPSLVDTLVKYCTVQLEWSFVREGNGTYYVYHNNQRIKTVQYSLTEVITGLEPGTNHEFYVTTENDQGYESDPGAIVSVTTLEPPSLSFITNEFTMCSTQKTITVTDIPYAHYTYECSGPLTFSNGYQVSGSSDNFVSIFAQSDNTTGSITVEASYGCENPVIYKGITIGTPTPSITAYKSSGYGEPTEYTFTATFFPGATYYWYVNGVEQTNYYTPENNTFSLYFPYGVSKTVKCKITNSCGTSAFSNSITKTGDFKFHSFILSPNPASNEITISQAENDVSLVSTNSGVSDKKEIKSYKIIDSNGYIYKTKKLGKEVYSTTINISFLKSGTYFLIINEEDGVAAETYSFIKN